MEYDVHEKVNDDNSLGHSNSETASGTENALSKKNGNGKRKRKRPRTKALRRTIREKIEIALCTSDSPIQDILETNMDCVVSAPLSSIVKLLKLDTDEYRRLSYKALISIGNLSKFFSIAGDSADTLQLVLKSNDLNHSSTVVYVDNLPDGCKVDSLKRWASTFGTVVFVHPIMVRKANPNKDSIKNGVSTSTKVSISPDCTGKFFQSAFIKFVDDQSSVDFIKFHQLLRKKAASRQRKKLKLGRKQTMRKSAKSISKVKSKKKLQRKRRKSKKAAENNAENHPKKAKKEEAIGTEVIDIEKPEVCVDNSSDVIKGESGNYSRRRKRKRRPSHGMGNILFKKSKTTTDAEKKIETEDDKSNGFENADPKRASVDISVAEKNHEIKDVEMEVGDGFTSVKNVPQLTVVTIDESLKKTFRDVGTDVPEEFLLGEVNGVMKKRKRVHRQKRCNGKPKNCNPRPKKYFHDMQVYSLDTFQKLREKYLELQKQQMIQLKASLKKKNISSTLMGLTKKEWKRKRGRCRLMMRAAKLREEHEDLFHRIPEEDKLADV
ncbi:Glutaminase [Dirofilaria immitis]